jgi:SAM-dependent methyltransferase
MSIEPHAHLRALAPSDRSTRRSERHARTTVAVARALARLLRDHAGGRGRLLQIGAGRGHHAVLLADQLRGPEAPVIYDARDRRDPEVAARTRFAAVDVEREAFPAADAAFDVALCHEVMVEMKDVRPLLAETARVLAPGGLFLVTLPNLAALHNVALLALGRQPSTLHIAGSHVRAFAIHSFGRHITGGGRFRQLAVRGIGLHPFTSAAVPGPLRTWSHTVAWLFERTEAPA